MELSDKLKESLSAHTTTEKVEEAPAPAPVSDTNTDADDPLFQQYSSARQSCSLITPTGARINFTNYEFYTKEPAFIEYIDSLIDSGVRGFKKGKAVHASEVNPMAALKRKHIEEFLASQTGRDFTGGQITKQQAMAGVGTLTTDGVIAR